MSIPQAVRPYLAKLTLPNPSSHKGDNGKLLIIGGSELFHAASKWSLDIASKFVDMVFYSSVPLNNALVKEAKANFWNGIVVPRDDLTAYLEEADCILLGPGMERTAATAQLSNQLLSTYSHKRWVLDAGALQMLEPALLESTHIITPHHGELRRLLNVETEPSREEIVSWLRQVSQPTLLLKGPIDQVFITEEERTKLIEVGGGNAGMTKGGTGDVLAGLVAAFYCTQEAAVSAVAASYFNKRGGDELYRKVGPFYNASQLVTKLPQVVWRVLQQV